MRRAFSLIELLVVLAVIALIAALLLPTIQLVRDAARRTVCGNHMRQIGLGMEAFAQDDEARRYPWAKLRSWPGSDTYLSPLIAGGYFGDGRGWDDLRYTLFNCPADRVAKRGDYWFDYAPSVYLLGLGDPASWGAGAPSRTVAGAIPQASRTVLLAEVIVGTPWWVPCYETPADHWSGWTAVHRGRANDGTSRCSAPERRDRFVRGWRASPWPTLAS